MESISLSMVNVLRMVIFLELALFAIIYSKKRISNIDKNKSDRDMTWLKSLLLAIQILIAMAVCYNLVYHEEMRALSWGSGLSSIGIFIIYTAKRTLGQNFLECTDMYIPKDIIMVGIYKFIRHPIYTGNLIFLSGLSIACRSYVLGLVTITFFFIYRRSAVLEENELQSKFIKYHEYKNATGRFFPRIF